MSSLRARVVELEKILVWIKRVFVECDYCTWSFPRNEMYRVKGEFERTAATYICKDCLKREAHHCKKLQEATPLKEE